ncbi:CHAD domain protein [Burkholderia thailandensis 34]|uniref:CHAD domain-containing protein n=1 Tax=Burkholderia thailandensis TaxID=57975 RepID=UPI0005D81E07|nr:CHAD domain-containing protein [Burkholderia thailandensis]AJY30849.1 CHAD domain protein [Burkholderia thailandensis 34]AOJ59152.1 metal-chelation protein CHAD [Burkholderia thailandensis]KXF58272.1 metal-chelation protein CHAD [Burkholderia thailandensis]PNE76967.1 CHAD domain-containing protein [Burkholderia thailandensis]
MARVLEIVLDFPLQGWQAGRGARARARDLGAELARAWRICPPVKMRRGHERVTIEPCRFVEAEPDDGGRWQTWIETTAQARRVLAVRCHPFVPGVMVRERLDDYRGDVRVATPAAGASVASDASGATDAGGDSRPSASTAASVFAESAAQSADSAPMPGFAAGRAAFRESRSPYGPAYGFVADRRRGRWLDADGIDVELTLDDIAFAPAAASSETARAASSRVCELRLAVADPDDSSARAAALRALFNAARELSGAWPASLATASVLDRACMGDAPDAAGSPAKAQPVDLSTMRTQRAAFFALGCGVTAQWLGNEAGARDMADPEFVHQMRVALRRLRTLVRLFPRYADESWKDAFSGDIRWLAGMLGAVRDWDVCVTSTLPALAAADSDEAAWAGTLDAARAQGDAARAELRQALGTARYTRLVFAWLEWLSLFSLGEDDPARGKAPSLKRHAAKRVSRLFGHLYGAGRLTTLDAAARHRVRIDAKRLRYALEFFSSLASRRTREDTVRLLARLQNALGDANDAAVALRCLERLSAPPYQLGFARGYGAAAQRYAAEAGEQMLRGMRVPKIGGRKA